MFIVENFYEYIAYVTRSSLKYRRSNEIRLSWLLDCGFLSKFVLPIKNVIRKVESR